MIYQRVIIFSCIISFVFVSAFTEVFAQERFSEKWRWVRFSTENGLLEKDILDVQQDGKGVVWAIGKSRVYWYDQYKWNSLLVNANKGGNKKLLYSGKHMYLYADRQLYQLGKQQLKEVKLLLPGKRGEWGIGAICCYGNDHLLLLLNNGKEIRTYLYNEHFFQEIPFPAVKAGGPSNLFYTGQKNAYLLANRKTYKLSNARWEEFLHIGEGIDVRMLEELPDGRVYLYMLGGNVSANGLWLFDKTSSKLRHTGRFRFDNLNTYALSPDQELFLTFSNGTVEYLDKQRKWQSMKMPDDMISVNSIFFSRQNKDIWFGNSENIYVFRKSSERWRYYASDKDPSYNRINEIVCRKNGDIWTATHGALVINHKDGSQEYITQVNELPMVEITAINEDRAGNIWLGSGRSFKGTLRWDGLTWKHYTSANGFTDAYVHKIRKDRSGNLCFLTITHNNEDGDGAYLYKDGLFRHFGLEHGLCSKRIYAFAESEDGWYWFGSSKGISSYKEGKTRQWKKIPQLTGHERVFSIVCDKQKRTWFSTVTGRIFFIDYTGRLHEKPMPENFNARLFPSDLSLDNQDNLWISSSNGVWCYDGLRTYHFTIKDGLNNLPVWPLQYHDERMLIGTMGAGLHVLNLAEARNVKYIFNGRAVVFAGRDVDVEWDVQVSNESHNKGDQLVRYRIDEGVWTDYMNRHKLSLSGLSYGKHHFTLELSPYFPDRYRKLQKEFDIEIPYPYYLELPFLIIIGISFITITILVFSYGRKKNQNKSLIMANRDLLKSINKNISEGLYRTSINGQIIYINHSFARLFGYDSVEDMSDISAHSLYYYPAQREELAKKIRDAGRFDNEEVLFRKRDGSAFWALVSSTGIRDEEGGLLYYDGLIMDITERKRNIEQLQESEEKYRSLIDTMNEALVYVDNDDHLQFANRRLFSLLGYGPEELKGQPLMNIIVHPDDRSIVKGKNYLRTQKVADTYELRFITKAGELIWVHVSGRPIENRKGEVIGSLATISDISELRAAYDALKISEQKFQSFMDNIPAIAWIKNEEGRYAYINRLYEETFNLKHEQVLDKKASDLFAAEVSEVSMNSDAEIYDYGRKAETIEENPGFDGQNKTWLVHKFPMRNAGKVYLGGIAINISSLIEVQQELQKSLKEKEVLLREIHHRVKNNLQIISSLLNLQAKYLKDPDKAELFLESQNRIRSMALIHEKLYQSSNIELIDFGDYTRSICHFLYKSYVVDPTRIKLNLIIENIDIDIEYAVPLGLLLNELVVNSIKYAFVDRQSGNISITLKREESILHLDIADDGVGIPEDFNIQESNSLGLQLVNSLIEQVRGTLILDRSQGTCFHIQVPYKEKAQR